MEMFQPLHQNNFQTRTDATANENLFSKRSALRRLVTFRSNDTIIHKTLTRGTLASLGFSKTQHNTIKCQGCRFETKLLTTSDDLVNNHRSHNSQCCFLQQPNTILQLNNNQSSEPLPTNNRSDSRSTRTLTQIQTKASSDVASSLKIFLESLSDQTLDKMRTYSFSNWPLITPSANEMINAGWSYTNISDRVICVHCNALYHTWAETDRPYEIHRLRSPHCRFVLSAERNTIDSSNRNTGITTEPMTEAAVDSINSTYALSTRRLQSFESWPHSEKNPLPPIQSFVDAGFYYTGKSTSVKCFYCNGALQNWMAGDDPKVEHARWYPLCNYIRQYIGQDLYEAIQRKNKDLKAQQSNSKQAVPWTEAELDKMVKARLDLPSAEKMRNFGFSMAIIKKALEMQLKFKRDDFKTDNDLYLACLILELQVQLINGNQANLLVPKDWLENLHHIQEQPQSQDDVLEIEPMETEKIESKPAIIQPPKIAQLSKDESTCIVCMSAERQVACLPCGHLTSCVACGHSLKTCPICRTPVKAFVRIYV